jgi:hypothetical protein
MPLIAGRTAQEYHRRKNRNVESELGSKAMHRDIVTANEIVDLTSSL